jgi:predicted ribonuclease YlaK
MITVIITILCEFIQIEEVCAATAAEVLTLLISSGEPQMILLVGDPNQLRPRYNSRLAQIFYGGVSFIDLLKRRHDFFEPDIEWVFST